MRQSIQRFLGFASCGVACLLVSCKASETTAGASRTLDAPRVAPLAQDREMWLQLLGDHTSITRTLRHRQEGAVGIVESLTESDDPQVAQRITRHAEAMRARMIAGAQVRVWDPVFEELFARHEHVTLEVMPTPRGVRVVESSRDPETIALMRSHAMGVNEFVRAGHAAAPKHTLRLPVGAPMPPDEVAVGGVAHRFLLGQPTAEQIALLKQQGASGILNFRTPGEEGVIDEATIAAQQGLTYTSLPYRSSTDLNDSLLHEARARLAQADAAGESLILHCRTGNRVGPAWAAYLALDKGVPVDRAIRGALAVGMKDPQLERAARVAIEASHR